MDPKPIAQEVVDPRKGPALVILLNGHAVYCFLFMLTHRPGVLSAWVREGHYVVGSSHYKNE